MGKQRDRKTEMLVMRVTAEQKAAIRAAADRALKPISDFALEAILDAVRKANEDSSSALGDGDRTAAMLKVLERARGGGSTGYRWAGQLVSRLFPELAQADSTPLRGMMVAEEGMPYGADELNARDQEAIGREFVQAMELVLFAPRDKNPASIDLVANIPNRRMKAIGLGALDGREALRAGLRGASEPEAPPPKRPAKGRNRKTRAK